MTPPGVTLTHSATFSLWSVERACDVPTRVDTYWLDREGPARDLVRSLEGPNVRVRIFRDARSSLGLWRVVRYAPIP